MALRYGQIRRPCAVSARSLRGTVPERHEDKSLSDLGVQDYALPGCVWQDAVVAVLAPSCEAYLSAIGICPRNPGICPRNPCPRNPRFAPRPEDRGHATVVPIVTVVPVMSFSPPKAEALLAAFSFCVSSMSDAQHPFRPR